MFGLNRTVGSLTRTGILLPTLVRQYQFARLRSRPLTSSLFINNSASVRTFVSVSEPERDALAVDDEIVSIYGDIGGFDPSSLPQDAIASFLAEQAASVDGNEARMPSLVGYVYSAQTSADIGSIAYQVRNLETRRADIRQQSSLYNAKQHKASNDPQFQSALTNLFYTLAEFPDVTVYMTSSREFANAHGVTFDNAYPGCPLLSTAHPNDVLPPAVVHAHSHLLSTLEPLHISILARAAILLKDLPRAITLAHYLLHLNTKIDIAAVFDVAALAARVGYVDACMSIIAMAAQQGTLMDKSTLSVILANAAHRAGHTDGLHTALALLLSSSYLPRTPPAHITTVLGAVVAHHLENNRPVTALHALSLAEHTRVSPMELLGSSAFLSMIAPSNAAQLVRTLQPLLPPRLPLHTLAHWLQLCEKAGTVAAAAQAYNARVSMEESWLFAADMVAAEKTGMQVPKRVFQTSTRASAATDTGASVGTRADGSAKNANAQSERVRAAPVSLLALLSAPPPEGKVNNQKQATSSDAPSESKDNRQKVESPSDLASAGSSLPRVPNDTAMLELHKLIHGLATSHTVHLPIQRPAEQSLLAAVEANEDAEDSLSTSSLAAASCPAAALLITHAHNHFFPSFAVRARKTRSLTSREVVYRDMSVLTRDAIPLADISKPRHRSRLATVFSACSVPVYLKSLPPPPTSFLSADGPMDPLVSSTYLLQLCSAAPAWTALAHGIYTADRDHAAVSELYSHLLRDEEYRSLSALTTKTLVRLLSTSGFPVSAFVLAETAWHATLSRARVVPVVDLAPDTCYVHDYRAEGETPPSPYVPAAHKFSYIGYGYSHPTRDGTGFLQFALGSLQHALQRQPAYWNTKLDELSPKLKKREDPLPSTHGVSRNRREMKVMDVDVAGEPQLVPISGFDAKVLGMLTKTYIPTDPAALVHTPLAPLLLHLDDSKPQSTSYQPSGYRNVAPQNTSIGTDNAEAALAYTEGVLAIAMDTASRDPDAAAALLSYAMRGPTAATLTAHAPLVTLPAHRSGVMFPSQCMPRQDSPNTPRHDSAALPGSLSLAGALTVDNPYRFLPAFASVRSWHNNRLGKLPSFLSDWHCVSSDAVGHSAIDIAVERQETEAEEEEAETKVESVVGADGLIYTVSATDAPAPTSARHARASSLSSTSSSPLSASSCSSSSPASSSTSTSTSTSASASALSHSQSMAQLAHNTITPKPSWSPYSLIQFTQSHAPAGLLSPLHSKLTVNPEATAVNTTITPANAFALAVTRLVHLSIAVTDSLHHAYVHAAASWLASTLAPYTTPYFSNTNDGNLLAGILTPRGRRMLYALASPHWLYASLVDSRVLHCLRPNAPVLTPTSSSSTTSGALSSPLVLAVTADTPTLALAADVSTHTMPTQLLPAPPQPPKGHLAHPLLSLPSLLHTHTPVLTHTPTSLVYLSGPLPPYPLLPDDCPAPFASPHFRSMAAREMGLNTMTLARAIQRILHAALTRKRFAFATNLFVTALAADGFTYPALSLLHSAHLHGNAVADLRKHLTAHTHAADVWVRGALHFCVADVATAREWAWLLGMAGHMEAASKLWRMHYTLVPNTLPTMDPLHALVAPSVPGLCTESAIAAASSTRTTGTTSHTSQDDALARNAVASMLAGVKRPSVDSIASLVVDAASTTISSTSSPTPSALVASLPISARVIFPYLRDKSMVELCERDNIPHLSPTALKQQLLTGHSGEWEHLPRVFGMAVGAAWVGHVLRGWSTQATHVGALKQALLEAYRPVLAQAIEALLIHTGIVAPRPDAIVPPSPTAKWYLAQGVDVRELLESQLPPGEVLPSTPWPSFSLSQLTMEQQQRLLSDMLMQDMSIGRLLAVDLFLNCGWVGDWHQRPADNVLGLPMSQAAAVTAPNPMIRYALHVKQCLDSLIHMDKPHLVLRFFYRSLSHPTWQAGLSHLRVSLGAVQLHALLTRHPLFSLAQWALATMAHTHPVLAKQLYRVCARHNLFAPHIRTPEQWAEAQHAYADGKRYTLIDSATAVIARGKAGSMLDTVREHEGTTPLAGLLLGSVAAQRGAALEELVHTRLCAQTATGVPLFIVNPQGRRFPLASTAGSAVHANELSGEVLAAVSVDDIPSNHAEEEGACVLDNETLHAAIAASGLAFTNQLYSLAAHSHPQYTRPIARRDHYIGRGVYVISLDDVTKAGRRRLGPQWLDLLARNKDTQAAYSLEPLTLNTYIYKAPISGANVEEGRVEGVVDEEAPIEDTPTANRPVLELGASEGERVVSEAATTGTAAAVVTSHSGVSYAHTYLPFKHEKVPMNTTGMWTITALLAAQHLQECGLHRCISIPARLQSALIACESEVALAALANVGDNAATAEGGVVTTNVTVGGEPVDADNIAMLPRWARQGLLVGGLADPALVRVAEENVAAHLSAAGISFGAAVPRQRMRVAANDGVAADATEADVVLEEDDDGFARMYGYQEDSRMGGLSGVAVQYSLLDASKSKRKVVMDSAKSLRAWRPRQDPMYRLGGPIPPLRSQDSASAGGLRSERGRDRSKSLRPSMNTILGRVDVTQRADLRVKRELYKLRERAVQRQRWEEERQEAERREKERKEQARERESVEGVRERVVSQMSASPHAADETTVSTQHVRVGELDNEERNGKRTSWRSSRTHATSNSSRASPMTSKNSTSTTSHHLAADPLHSSAVDAGSASDAEMLGWLNPSSKQATAVVTGAGAGTASMLDKGLSMDAGENKYIEALKDVLLSKEPLAVPNAPTSAFSQTSTTTFSSASLSSSTTLSSSSGSEGDYSAKLRECDDTNRNTSKLAYLHEIPTQSGVAMRKYVHRYRVQGRVFRKRAEWLKEQRLSGRNLRPVFVKSRNITKARDETKSQTD